MDLPTQMLFNKDINRATKTLGRNMIWRGKVILMLRNITKNNKVWAGTGWVKQPVEVANGN